MLCQVNLIYIYLKGNLKEESIENARDQGFARPKVLILCPMRKDALSLVNLFRTLIFGNSDRPFISNFHRFQKEFGGSDCGISEKRNVINFFHYSFFQVC